MDTEAHFVLGTSAVKTIAATEMLDLESLEKAKARFEDYRKSGIIYDCAFDDVKWNTTDEYSHITLNFNFNKVTYKRWYQEYFELSFEDFLNLVKSFYVFSLGRNVLKTFQTSIW